MYLLLGPSLDPFHRAVSRSLEGAGREVRFVSNPLAEPFLFRWHLEPRGDRTAFARRAGGAIEALEVEGVLVRAPVWLDRAGWEEGDLVYAQTEMQAALLGWLHALRCPVVNRYPSGVWFRPRVPTALWQAPLRRAGLPAQEAVVTNVPEEARSFSDAGLVYAPATGGPGYLVEDGEEWRGLAEVQRRTPTLLTRPHGAVTLAFVVGRTVVWDGVPPEGGALDEGLRRFAAEAGLAFVQVAVAPTAEGVRVVDVEPFPVVERASATTVERVAAEVAGLLLHPWRGERRGGWAPFTGLLP